MWSRVGLKAEVETLARGGLLHARLQAGVQRLRRPVRRRGGRQQPARARGDASIRAKGFGTANRTRYSNPIVDSLLTESNETDGRRGCATRSSTRAINFAIADQPLIPVFYPIFDFAAKKGLVVTPQAQRRFNAHDGAPGGAKAASQVRRRAVPNAIVPPWRPPSRIRPDCPPPGVDHKLTLKEVLEWLVQDGRVAREDAAKLLQDHARARAGKHPVTIIARRACAPPCRSTGRSTPRRSPPGWARGCTSPSTTSTRSRSTCAR